jgi:DNA-binding transcriptional ArsR family regulator
MENSRLDSLEKKTEQIARGLNELQSRLDFLQSQITRPSTLEQLAVKVGSSDIMRGHGSDKTQISESMKPLIKELVKQKDRWVSAGQIAQKTKRSRNVESSHLQRLFEKGYLSRQRSGRTVYYAIRKAVPEDFQEE